MTSVMNSWSDNEKMAPTSSSLASNSTYTNYTNMNSIRIVSSDSADDGKTSTLQQQNQQQQSLQQHQHQQYLKQQYQEASPQVEIQHQQQSHMSSTNINNSHNNSINSHNHSNNSNSNAHNNNGRDNRKEGLSPSALKDHQADTMAALKLRRLTNLTNRLRTELNYERIPASQACEALLQFMQNAQNDPKLKDYLVPEVYGKRPVLTLDSIVGNAQGGGAGGGAGGGELGGFNIANGGYYFEDEEKMLISPTSKGFSSKSNRGCCIIS